MTNDAAQWNLKRDLPPWIAGFAVLSVMIVGLIWFFSPKLTGRQILGSGWSKLQFDNGTSLGISVEELEKCRGPISEMLSGSQPVTINGYRFERCDVSGPDSLLVSDSSGRRKLVIEKNTRLYRANGSIFIVLAPLDPDHLVVGWQFPGDGSDRIARNAEKPLWQRSFW